MSGDVEAVRTVYPSVSRWRMSTAAYGSVAYFFLLYLFLTLFLSNLRFPPVNQVGPIKHSQTMNSRLRLGERNRERASAHTFIYLLGEQTSPKIASSVEKLSAKKLQQ